MQRNIKIRMFVSHAIFRALSVFVFAALINLSLNFSTHALPSISVSSDNNVTITGDDIGGYVAPTPAGALGVGVDHVNVTTDCSSGYKLYVSGTSTSSTDLVREDAEDQTLESNRISTSSTAVGSESALAKNTWGVGKNGTDFAKIQDYSLDPGTWTPLYTGTDNSTFNVYYGLNISMGKEPGIYSGEVLYTAILDEACLKYTLEFDTSSATTVDSTVFESKSIEYGTNVDLLEFSNTTSISRTGYTLTGWKYTASGVEHEFVITANENINPDDIKTITLVPVWTPITYNIIYEPGETGGTCSEVSTPVQYDGDATLSDVICTKTGHTQDGWSGALHEGTEKDYDLSEVLEHPNFSSVEGATYVLYPHFTINSHLLTINSDSTTIESTSPESGEVEYNTEITATCVAKTGYHCAGWTSEDQSILPDTVAVNYTFNMPDNPVTLTAVANPNTYTIRYNANGGTGETDSQTGQAYGSTTTLQQSGFLRSGHHFIGWAYSDSAATPDFTGGESVSVTELAENNAAGSVVDTTGGTIDLYALWDINNYTFTFDVNGGTGYPASASSSASYDGTIVPPGVGTMERERFEFIGWSLDSSAETEDYTPNVSYNASSIVSAAGKTNENDANITLYAVWSGYPYTLRTVNGNTTAISSISPDTTGTTKRYGSSVTVSCTPKTGYHCTGWTSSDTSLLPNSSNASYTFTMPGDITLTANGAVNTYTIKYNANGGSGSTDSQTGQSYGSTVTLRSNGFSRTGYSFQGWAYSPYASSRDFTASQSSVSVSTLAANNYNGSVVDTNGGTINLYAVWTPNNYTIAYSAGSTGGSCSVSSTSATYDSYATLSSTKCSKDGYHQDGWSTSSSSSNSKDYNMGYSYAYNLTTSGTVYLYPHFVPNTYYIYYYGGGGSGSVSYQSVTYGNSISLRANGFSRSGYDFLGWGSSGASSPSYYASSSYSASSLASWAGVTNTDGGSIYLYAVWQQQITYYTLTVSSGYINSTGRTTGSYAYNDSVYICANSPSTNYSFSYWSSNNGGSFSNQYSSCTYFYMPSKSVTVTANYSYSPPTYTLTVINGYVGSSGTSTSGSYTSGTSVTIRANVPSGNTFTSWSSNNGGSFSSSSSSTTTFTMPSANVTVTAGYKSNTKYMQDSGICATLTAGATSTITDSRDGQSYTVYRFPTSGSYPSSWKGDCLMTKDLNIGQGSNTSLSTSTSAGSGTLNNISSLSNWPNTPLNDTNMNYYYANGRGYYAYGAAIRVCPKGWSLPSKSLMDNLGNFIGNSNAARGTAIQASPYNFNITGYINASTKSMSTGWGHYWYSDLYGSASARVLQLSSSWGTNNSTMSSGNAIRCVATD